MPYARLFIFLLLTGLLPGCDNPVSHLERNNPNDPKSAVFHPKDPTGLTLILEEDAVVLRWLDNSVFEDGYLVEKTSGAGDFTPVASLAPGTTTYRDTSPVAHVSTSYRVSAFVGGATERRLTSTEEARLDLGRIFEFRLEPTDGGVRLEWHDAVRFEDGFIVDVLLKGQSTELAVLPPNSSAYTDTSTPLSFSSDPTYSVRPFMVRSGGRMKIDSVAQSLEVSESFAPTDVHITFLDEQTTEVTWSDHSHFESGFLLEWAIGGSSVYDEVAVVEANATSFIHEFLLVPELLYSYRVRALGGSRHEADASVVSVSDRTFQISAPDAYLAPSSDPAHVSLRWDHDEPLARGYVIERAESGRGPAVERARLPATARSYEDADVRAGASYYYYVRTLSSYSDAVRTQFVRTFRDEGVLQGHRKPAFGLAFSPDGRLLASGTGHWYGENHVNVWDLETGTLLHELRHAGAVTSIAFSPDGRTLATAAEENATSVVTRLNLWDVASGQRTRVFSEGFTYKVTFHPGGELVGGIGGQGSVWFWERATGERAYHVDWVEEITTRPVGLAFNSDGTQLVTSGNYFDVILRNGRTGAEERRLRTIGNKDAFSFTPDDDLLAAGQGCTEFTVTGEIEFLDVASGREIRRISGCALGFSPDGALYASGYFREDYTRIIHFRTTRTGELHAVTEGWAAAFHPDGRRIAVALEDGSIHIRSIAEERWIEL